MKKGDSHQIWRICVFVFVQLAQIWWLSPFLVAGDLSTVAGPAMGTTYRVTLAHDVPGMSLGEVHREVERVLARVDLSLSTWRPDSDASRFNEAQPGEWIDVAPDLIAVVAIARRVYDETQGAFDITSGERRIGCMRDLELRSTPPALRKTGAGLVLDLGGIGPGYAVDEIGVQLRVLGSTDHLVELGGEVRAWGSRPDGRPWQVALRDSASVVDLADGEALATSTARPGRSPLDPRTGRVVEACASSMTVRAATCAEADARAVAKLVLEATHPAAGRNHEE
jgi:thiamine biosynthesis lipoprotein